MSTKNMNKKYQVWLPLLLSVVMIVGMLAGYQLEHNLNWKKSGSRNIYPSSSLQQVMDLITYKYVDSLALDSLEADGIEAIVEQLDPHSNYIPPSSLSEVNADLQGNFSGIGVEYQIINDTVNVVYVLEKGPSDRAGIKTGDQILKVDTVNIAGTSKQGGDLRTYLRGKPGSKVNVTILQNGAIKKVEITRGNIPLPSLDASYMAAPGVGYIRLNKFAETTYREFMDAATGLQKQGMTKMILDLRGNGGGLLEQATNIADELLEDGLLMVSTRGNHVKTKQIYSMKPGIFEEGELILLIDEFSASASEVLAAALQDNDRGTIVGRRSFGKGLVQEQYDLDNGGALRLTVARYYTPTGRSIQKPYTNGHREKYREEILARFHHTDTNTADSIHGKSYKTKGGKLLYDAGGITPDVLVPFDSTVYPARIAGIYNSQLLGDFVFTLFKDQRAQMKKYNSAESLLKEYTVSETDWQKLVVEAQKDSLQLQEANAKTKQQVELRMKALLARYVWRNNGYFQLLNSADSTYQKAVDIMKAK
jgi:carboxyl-terminal processing protease